MLKTKHPIVFAFIPINDYNTIIVKVFIFFFSFCIYYAVNGLFITEDTIHQIYKDRGSYNFRYSLPKIIVSFVISHAISIVIKYVFLSERNILEIKKENSLIEAKIKVDKVKRAISIKFIIFLFPDFYYLYYFGIIYHLLVLFIKILNYI